MKLGMPPNNMLKTIKNITDFENTDDVAHHFGISYKNLAKIIYYTPDQYKYFQFKISKRNGDERVISSPCLKLKEIQKKLNIELQQIYKARNSVTGFVKNRNIITNARKHLNKKIVLNIDLKNFFDQVHFGRVKRLFMSQPFNYSHEVATVIAQICCFDNKLPQGAPTSPVITNMICYKMDKQLQDLASKSKATYSRYCDDITFSFTTKKISKAILAEKNELVIGTHLENIITSNGFEINLNKIRVYNHFQRMLVTGIKVNEFPNVNREYITKIRAMLHAWEKYGYDNSRNTFIREYMTPRQKRFSSPPEFRNVLRGKLNYLKMVRGKRDHLYIKYAKWFNLLVNNFNEKPLKFIEETDEERELLFSTLIVKCYCEDEKTKNLMMTYGTGFYIKDIGIVTCAHVVTDLKQNIYEKIEVFTSGQFLNTFVCKVEIIDQHIDIAILKPDDLKFYDNLSSFSYILDAVELKQDIKLLGYPAYSDGQSPSIFDSKVSSTFAQNGVSKFEIAGQIREGNSGGPVLNLDNQVIGIANEGAEKGFGKNAVIKVTELINLLKK